MAKSGTFQTKQNTTVRIITESNMGTTPTDSAYITMPVTDFTFDDIQKHSLGSSTSTNWSWRNGYV